MQVKRTRLPRACRNCHKSVLPVLTQKIKCSGEQPCRPCQKRSLNCVFDAVSQKRGRKPKRNLEVTDIKAAVMEEPISSPDVNNEDSNSTDSGPGNIPSVLTFSTDPDEHWTHEKLFDQRIVGRDGVRVHWIDKYYEIAYERFPLLPRKVMDDYFFELPISLVFGVYLIINITLNLPVSEKHYEIWQRFTDRGESNDLFEIMNRLHHGAAMMYVKDSTFYQQTISEVVGRIKEIMPMLEVHKYVYGHIDPKLLHSLGCRIACMAFLHDSFRVQLRAPFVFQPTDFELSYIDGLEESIRIDPIVKAMLKTALTGTRPRDFINHGLVELVVMRDAFSKFQPYSEDHLDGTEMGGGRLWHSSWHLELFYLKTILLQNDLLEALDCQSTDVSILSLFMIEVNNVCGLIRGILLHNPLLIRAPWVVGHAAFLAALISCAISLRSPTLIAGIDDLQLAVENTQKNMPFQLSFSNQIKLAIENPSLAKSLLQDHFQLIADGESPHNINR